MPAAAQQAIVINDAQSATNGGNTVDGDDRIAVTGNGSITTQGDRGIDATGDNNTIINDGAIATSAARGINSTGDNNTITNAGSITSSNARGINANGTRNTVTNEGSIATVGERGINAFDGGNTITNTGFIDTSDARGISVANGNNTVTNDGTITTSNARGISGSGGGSTFTNTGSITTSEGRGISAAGGNNAVINQGSIETSGDGIYGLFASGGENTITNSGRLVSRQGPALYVDAGAGNTINLRAPGFVRGALEFTAATDTTVTIATGPSHSVFWTLEGEMVNDSPDFSGSVPWFYDAAAQTVATFDPTLLAVETAALGDLTSLAFQLGLGALDGPNPAVGGNGPLAYGPATDFAGGTYAADRIALEEAAALDMRKGWATVFGGLAEHEGADTTIDADTAHLGFAAGTTWQHAPEMTLNVMAGYAHGDWSGDSAWSHSFDHDTHTGFAGLHGERALDRGRFGEADVRFGVTAGYIAVDHNRLVNDNLAPLGESWVSADYGGFFVAPEVAVSTDVAMGNGLTLTPNTRLRYAALWLGGYTETGAVDPAANATVEARMVGMVEARAELAVEQRVNRGTVSGRIGYLGRFNAGDDATGITLNSVTQDVGSGFEALNAIYLGGGARWSIGAAGVIAFDGQVMRGDTARGASGALTVGMRF